MTLFVSSLSVPLIVGIGMIGLIIIKRRANPTQLLVLGFFSTIVIGTGLLTLPFATNPHVSLSLLDAFFTATSAVCVTGLSTLPINQTLSIYGQGILLGLIQIGGLGIMAISALMAQVLSQKRGFHHQFSIHESFGTANSSQSRQILKAIFFYTLFFEAIGVIWLMFAWKTTIPATNQRLFYAFFHAISAFCNAGFSLFSDSMTTYSTHLPTLVCLAALITVGGLGFPVLFNLRYWLYPRHHPSHQRIKFHTKVVLGVSLILIIGGTALLAIDPAISITDAFFHSISARTAGFSSVSLTQWHASSLLIMIVLMFIGASPGSTGGGLRTTTIGILVAAAWQRMHHSDQIHWMNRRIPQRVILKALAILVFSMSIISLFLYMLLWTESAALMTTLFEVISATGTVGLSLGLTATLSSAGKLAIIILMFIGRVGPLTFAFSLSRQRPSLRYEVPEERIMVA